MATQIVEITDPGCWLRKKRGFLEIHRDGALVGKVVLDDIAAVIVSTLGGSLTTTLIDELAEKNVPIVLSGQNYLPSSIIFPTSGQGGQYRVMRAQADMKAPRRKQGWKRVVISKILNQREVLIRRGVSGEYLKRLAGRVKSGDTENCEAQAARYYWQALLGEEFRRDRDQFGVNSALNYGYAILRSTVARGIAAAGLHPSFSLHHRNRQNPINLVDDLIEPFRPVVDWQIAGIEIDDEEELGIDDKRRLASIVGAPVLLNDDVSLLSIAVVKVARGFANYCLGKTDDFLLPSLASEIEMANALG